MSTDINGLKAAIGLVAHTVSAVMKSGGKFEIGNHQRLIPDIFALVPVIGEIPAEAKDLDPNEMSELVAHFAAELALPVGRTQRVVEASIKLIHDIVVVIVPDVKAVIEAANS